jgi:hypothetical protein
VRAVFIDREKRRTRREPAAVRDGEVVEGDGQQEREEEERRSFHE